jgi:hypothetical protein
MATRLLLLLTCVVLLGIAMAAAAVRPGTTTTIDDARRPIGHCDQDLQDLISNCQDYVKFPADPKIPPSAACCAVVQRVNMPCLCSKVTPTVETLICMDKVVYVAGYCKRPLKPGSHCGSEFLNAGLLPLRAKLTRPDIQFRQYIYFYAIL